MNSARRWTQGLAALAGLASTIALQAASPSPSRVLPIALCAMPSAAPQPLSARTAGFTLKGNLTQGGVVIGIAPAGSISLTFESDAVPIASDGSFLIGFDRDSAPCATLSAILVDGRTTTKVLTIAPRQWHISRLATLPKYPVPPAQFDKIRPGEIAQINAARRLQNEVHGWQQPFLWPATGPISTLFGSQRIYKDGEAGSYHSGIDVAVPQGTPVLAPADGVVVLASDHPFLLEGNLLVIDHGVGLNSAFLHLSRIVATRGQFVKRGQVIAYSGMTGRVTGPHLHWSLRWRNSELDPLLVAGPMLRRR